MATKTGAGRRSAKRVTFTYPGGPGHDVRLAGSFNQWDPAVHRLTLKKGKGPYTLSLPLPEGRHEYKFIVDGEWLCDPACADRVPNGHGTHNSVVEVR